MKQRVFTKLGIFVASLIFSTWAVAVGISDPLPSWNTGQTKQSLIAFVNAVTNEHSPDFVPPKDRIATIDNDGTLWVEQPNYTQAIFMVDRFNQLAKTHPEWQTTEPFKSALKDLPKQLTKKDLETIFAVTSTNLSVEEYEEIVKHWLATATDPHFQRHYTELVYQPMLEVIRYLQANHFAVYIVSGGGQDFIRAFSESIYHIPIENVVGTTIKTKYSFQHGKPTLLKTPSVLFIDDKTGKPEAINLFVGKKPIIAFGNSAGDQQMLEWTQSGSGKRLMLLVHHDDAKREYAYDTQSKIGTFPTTLFNEANKNHWQIISMKNDWKVIFPFEINRQGMSQ